MTLTIRDMHPTGTNLFIWERQVEDHARWAFEVHPEAARIEFTAHFPTGPKTFTLDRSKPTPTFTFDFEAWKADAENRIEERREREEE